MNCINCNDTIKGYGKKYCSLSCANSHARRGVKIVDRTRKCLYCAKDFERREVEQKFCSRSCSAKSSNRDRKMVICVSCGKPCGTGKKYCSTDCRAEYRVKMWLRDGSVATNKYGIAGWCRDYMLEQSGYQCQMYIDGVRCSETRINESTGRTILQIDHIDGNWQNNHISNLRVLCPSCHATTETYGALNVGKGRTWKKEYSQFGGVIDEDAV